MNFCVKEMKKALFDLVFEKGHPQSENSILPYPHIG